ncbi:MAG: ATP-binding protein [Clostridiales bacterium]|nr:ATP-binding protein [Clostridiales bacterium]
MARPGNKNVKFPVGIEDFEKIRTENFYYVDKTIMIRDLLSFWGEVNLFTRPRRFGKSLTMSMLKYFFEIGCDKALFEGLKISEEKELCDKYMGQFPVISISMKAVNGNDYSTARDLAVKTINEEARRHSYLLDSEKLSDRDKHLFSTLLEREMDDASLVFSLRELSELLRKHYSKRVIILIDEYDVPLAKANDHGYYEQMVTLIRGLFEQSLKTNDSLYFAVLTGCLGVAKESIFTGLNNIRVFTVSSVRFDEYFGFTNEEVRNMLSLCGFEDKFELVKEWYDGYRFGNTDVYCPWDVINYCYSLTGDPSAQPESYWMNTSGNDVIRYFIQNIDNGQTRWDVEALIAGEGVSREIHEDLTYRQMYDTIDNIWSVLYTTGYLTQRKRLDQRHYQLAIPNREIREIFMEQILAMFKEKISSDGERLNDFCSALAAGDAEKVQERLRDYLRDTISIRDTAVTNPSKENFYHGILLGILGFKSSWYIKSNRESGDGYSDILIYIEDEEKGMVIEVKYAEKGEYDQACKKALEQINRLDYSSELQKWGCRIIYKYAIACYKKNCKVEMEE